MPRQVLYDGYKLLYTTVKIWLPGFIHAIITIDKTFISVWAEVGIQIIKIRILREKVDAIYVIKINLLHW